MDDMKNGQAPSLNELRQHDALVTLETSLNDLLKTSGDKNNLFGRLCSLQIASFSDDSLTPTDHKDHSFLLKMSFRLLNSVFDFKEAIRHCHQETITNGWEALRKETSYFLTCFGPMESVDKSFNWLLTSSLCDADLTDTYKDKDSMNYFVGMCREFIRSFINLYQVLGKHD